ncbi:MAG: LLM class flavin-dependent oxidoreductase [Caldilineaceae bacterium]|nr:LLM class flavin-dependent oxidoreductase [Caldilineaceae bacterium]
MTFPLSILDLIPIPYGGGGIQAVQNTLELAQLAEELGYHRYWLAEHHNFVGLAAVAPEVLIGVIARATKRIRVGSGGILLPNYAPLKVAETFRTLAALSPGRIDLGIGRAPNQDKRTALALRGSEAALAAADDIERLVRELEGYAEVAPSPFPADNPLHEVIASPEGVPFPPIWLLGSGQRSGKLAASRGRGFGAAYHFSPTEATKAIPAYKAAFQPSAEMAHPYAILCVSVICAENHAIAEDLKLTADLANLQRQKGERGAPPTVAAARAYSFSAEELEKLRPFAPIYGDPVQVRQALTELVTSLGADELMMVTNIADHAARRRSYELLAEAFALPHEPNISAATPSLNGHRRAWSGQAA